VVHRGGALTFLIQAVLLVVLLGVTMAIAASTRRQPRPEAWAAVPGHPGKDLVGSWALAGLGTPVFGMLGWLLAGGFGAGLALRAAGFLGTPAATDQNGPATSALVVPPPYFWAAGICLILVAANVIVFVYLLARWRAIRRDLIPRSRRPTSG